MKGLGFLIWQLKDMPPAGELVKLLKTHGVRWVSIKVADYDQPYNQIGGNDKVLRDEYIVTLQDAGIEVGGWVYIYPDRPGPQAGRASERIQKLGLSHLLLDVEGEWKKQNIGKAVDTYLNSLDVNKNFFVALTSYRYPGMHYPLPFDRWMKHEKVKATAPQVYWIGAHNPAKQIEDSFEEYAKWGKTFIPIGATFGDKYKYLDEWYYWEPTVDDLKEFTNAARKYPAYGFYSLDWLLKKGRFEWLEAISGQDGGPVEVPAKRYFVTVDNTNIRNAPQIVSSTDIGNLHKGAELKVIGETQDGQWLIVEAYVWKKNVEER